MSGIVAKLNHLRMSPRKVRLVVDLVRGMDVNEAEAQLAHMPKRATNPLRKLLRSAIANAEHNFQKERSALFIQTFTVDGATPLKRFRPRAFGRAADIRKRVSHVTLVLGERTQTKKSRRFTMQETRKPKEVATLEALGAAEKEAAEKHEKEFSPREAAQKRAGGITRKVTDIGKRFFRRKSV